MQDVLTDSTARKHVNKTRKAFADHARRRIASAAYKPRRNLTAEESEAVEQLRAADCNTNQTSLNAGKHWLPPRSIACAFCGRRAL